MSFLRAAQIATEIIDLIKEKRRIENQIDEKIQQMREYERAAVTKGSEDI